MTEPRTGVLKSDLPRLEQYLSNVVAEHVRETARSVEAVRAYCDRLDQSVAYCRATGYLCSACIERERISRDLRALLPAVPAMSGSPAGEVADERPGPVST